MPLRSFLHVPPTPPHEEQPQQTSDVAESDNAVARKTKHKKDAKAKKRDVLRKVEEKNNVPIQRTRDGESVREVGGKRVYLQGSNIPQERSLDLSTKSSVIEEGIQVNQASKMDVIHKPKQFSNSRESDNDVPRTTKHKKKGTKVKTRHALRKAKDKDDNVPIQRTTAGEPFGAIRGGRVSPQRSAISKAKNLELSTNSSVVRHGIELNHKPKGIPKAIDSEKNDDVVPRKPKPTRKGTKVKKRHALRKAKDKYVNVPIQRTRAGESVGAVGERRASVQSSVIVQEGNLALSTNSSVVQHDIEVNHAPKIDVIHKPKQFPKAIDSEKSDNVIPRKTKHTRKGTKVKKRHAKRRGEYKDNVSMQRTRAGESVGAVGEGSASLQSFMVSQEGNLRHSTLTHTFQDEVSVGQAPNLQEESPSIIINSVDIENQRLSQIPIHATLYEPRQRRSRYVEAQVICVEDPAEDTPSLKKGLLLAVLTCLVVLALCLGLGLGLSKRFQPQPEPSFSPSSSSTDAPHDPLMEDHLRMILEPVMDLGQMMDNITSPDYKAFHWLVYDDGNDILRESIGSEEDTSSSSWKVVQRYVTTLFYFATGGETTWQRQIEFLSNESECQWNEAADIHLPDVQLINNGSVAVIRPVISELQGISCNEEGQVTNISIQANHNTGSLPTALGLLSSLTNFQSNFNWLTGSLPTELSLLSNLVVLDLGVNFLTGTIPTEFGYFTNLEHFDLQVNRLNGKVPSELGTWSHIKSAYFSGNALSGSIPTNLGGWHNILDVEFIDNSLTGTLPTEVGAWANVERVCLFQNSLSGTIPSEIEEWVKIVELDLHDNALRGTIPTEVGAWTILERVYFDQNSLSGTIPTEIGAWTDLETVYFYQNSFSGSIPSEIGEWVDIIEVSLSDNALTGTIPTEIGTWTNLEVANFGFNSFSGAMPSEVGEWINVVKVGLYGNAFSGTIPTEIGAWTNVEMVIFQQNSLSGTIPREVGFWSNVTQMSMMENSLTGTIPTELGLWTNIEFAWFSNNSLTGPIPSELGQWPVFDPDWFAGNALDFVPTKNESN